MMISSSLVFGQQIIKVRVTPSGTGHDIYDSAFLVPPAQYNQNGIYPLIVLINGESTIQNIKNSNLPIQVTSGLLKNYFILCPVGNNKNWINDGMYVFATKYLMSLNQYRIDTTQIYYDTNN